MFFNWEMGISEHNRNIAKVLREIQRLKHQCIALKEERFWAVFPVGGSKRTYLIYSRVVCWELQSLWLFPNNLRL